MPKNKLVEDWMERLTLADLYKQEYGLSKDWKTYRQYTRNQFPASEGTDSLTYNISYEFQDVYLASLYYRNPTVFATPRNPQKYMFGKIVEGVDNWLIKELDLKSHVRKAIVDTIHCGRGFIKIGYEGKLDTTEKGALEELGYSEQATEIMSQGEGMPWVQRIDPDLILVPFGTVGMEDAEWIDHMILKPLDRVKKDKIYSNTANLKGSHTGKILSVSNKNEIYEKMMRGQEWVLLHEIHNREDGKILVFVDGYERFLRDEQDKMAIDGPPFESLYFTEDPEIFWATSEMAYLEPQQLELNEARTQSMMHRRISLLRILYQEGLVEERELEKFLSGAVGIGIKVKNGDIDKAIKIVTATMPQDVPLWAREVRSDAQEVMGISPIQAGQITSGRKTATEIERTQQAHNLRIGLKRDRVADFISKIMRKINQTIFEFWGQGRVVQVIGMDGATYWVELSAQAIKDEYDLDIDIESSSPYGKEDRKREIFQLIQAVGSNPNINPNYLWKLLLREFPWMDVMQMLPQANQGGPISTNQFVQQQNQMMANPQGLREAQGQNLGILAGAMS